MPCRVTPWLPPPKDTEGRTVADQAGDPDSLLACYRRFLHARRAHPALHRGDLTLLDFKQVKYPVVGWRRSADGRQVVVLLNVSRRRRKVRNPAPGGTLVVSTDGHRTEAAAPELVLEPWEGLVVEATGG